MQLKCYKDNNAFALHTYFILTCYAGSNNTTSNIPRHLSSYRDSWHTKNKTETYTSKGNYREITCPKPNLSLTVIHKMLALFEKWHYLVKASLQHF